MKVRSPSVWRRYVDPSDCEPCAECGGSGRAQEVTNGKTAECSACSGSGVGDELPDATVFHYETLNRREREALWLELAQEAKKHSKDPAQIGTSVLFLTSNPKHQAELVRQKLRRIDRFTVDDEEHERLEGEQITDEIFDLIPERVVAALHRRVQEDSLVRKGDAGKS